MEMMIKHHEKAIKRSHCLDKAEHAERRTRCQRIMTTQPAEIARCSHGCASRMASVGNDHLSYF